MSEFYANPHALGCPWHPAAEQFGAPNIKWCEETLCSWISEPANTWSNLLYIIFGLYLIYRTYKSENRELKWFGPAMTLMGIGSLIYHASNNYLTQIFDFLGMYLLVFWMLVINMRRIHWITKKHYVAVYAALCILCTLIIHFMYMNGIKFQLIVAISAFVLVGTEVWAMKKYPQELNSRKVFWIAVVFIAAAETFSLLDVNGVICDPHNHFVQGHAIWHILAAIGLYIAYLHYEKIDYKNLK